LNPHWFLKWTSLSDAQGFADAAMAMKYYLAQLLSDEETSFAEFLGRARTWQQLAQKPALPKEAWKCRVLGDNAVQNKEFIKAAEYYEQGLTIEPMWPAGQFNAAMIYGELRIYPLAAMHMKRYLTLKPDAPDSKVDQEKEYIWEEKAKEDNTASYDPNSLAPKE
jgi:tetratricopeptide (TPR) repeat protein